MFALHPIRPYTAARQVLHVLLMGPNIIQNSRERFVKCVKCVKLALQRAVSGYLRLVREEKKGMMFNR